jgi:hypothetical protein
LLQLLGLQQVEEVLFAIAFDALLRMAWAKQFTPLGPTLATAR